MQVDKGVGPLTASFLWCGCDLCMVFLTYLVLLAVLLFVVFFLVFVLTFANCANPVSFSLIPVQEQDLIIPRLTILSCFLLSFVLYRNLCAC